MTTPFPLTIAFYAQGLPFSGAPIETQSLGGSESAVWFMAQALAARGHKVDVFCSCPAPGIYEGVRYYDLKDFQRHRTAQEWDLFIASRYYPVLASPLRTKMNWLWMHDMPTEPMQLLSTLYRTEQIMALSAFHKQSYLDVCPQLAPLMWQTRNGVNEHLLNLHTGGKRHPKRLVYASRPERGLEMLMVDIWPRLLKADPDVELMICGYDMQSWDFPPEMRDFYQRLEQVIAQAPRVQQLGPLTKGQYYDVLASSALMAYPCIFPEISCLNAMESMHLGTPIITTDGFALKETVPYAGVPDLTDPSYPERFTERVLEVLNDPLQYKRLQKQGREWVTSRYQWKQVAAEWEARAFELFTARTEKAGERIAERLLFNSDVVVAQQVAVQHGYVDITAKAAHILAHHHEQPEEYFEHSLPEAEWQILHGRFKYIIDLLPVATNDITLKVMDLGCGSGALLGHIAKTRPDVVLGAGIDFSTQLIGFARAQAAQEKINDRLSFFHGDVSANEENLRTDFDVVIAAEILEHTKEYWQLINTAEHHCRQGGTILLTVPSGPWEANSFSEQPAAHSSHWHLHHFEQHDLIDIFGGKKNFRLEYVAAQETHWGELLGWWFIRYTNDASRATGRVNADRKWLTTQPRERIAACLIAKNEESNIRRCLDSLINIVDEIWIWDCGSKDRTVEIAERMGSRYWPDVHIHHLNTDPDGDGLGNFSAWRNQSISLTQAEWIYWMDCDEILVNGRGLRKYANYASLFQAYVIRQHHAQLQKGQPMDPDEPQRLFRNGWGYRFFGCIHEQPGVELNLEIGPALLLPDVDILHFGYTSADEVRRKCVERNLPLLKKDRQMNPDRALGPLLVLRDYLNMAQILMDAAGGINEQIVQFCRHAVTLYFEHYAQPDNKYHRHAFLYYQQALQFLAHWGLPAGEGWDIPMELQQSVRVVPGGANGDPMPPTRARWFANATELRGFLDRQSQQLATGLEQRKGTHGRHAL